MLAFFAFVSAALKIWTPDSAPKTAAQDNRSVINVLIGIAKMGKKTEGNPHGHQF